MHIYMVHVCVEAEVNVKKYPPSIATLFIEAGSLNQIQSSLMWLVLLAGSCHLLRLELEVTTLT